MAPVISVARLYVAELQTVIIVAAALVCQAEDGEKIFSQIRKNVCSHFQI